jgi:hypothetical protein
VTVVSGTTSEWKEADVFCFDDGSECVEHGDGATALPVEPGQQVGIDVSKAVVERGWYIELASPGADPQQSEVFADQHYFAFTAPSIGPEGLRLTVRAVGSQGEVGSSSGEWAFDLVLD